MKNGMLKKWISVALAFVLLLSGLVTGLVPAENLLAVSYADKAAKGQSQAVQEPIIEPQAIADYLFEHGKLPDNFITKAEARKLGWDNTRNDVSDVAPGMSIGGDKFGNYEKLLPTKKGRQYYEADCYYVKGNRNAHRIVYSNDGLVFYTNDHYQTFVEMKPSLKEDARQEPIIEPQAIADYLFEHGELPDNFITKAEARKLGWDSSRNYLSDVAPGMSIGGDKFGNYEKLLPTKKGRQYYEADCYYVKGKRNAHRIVYSNDGLVFYTGDHYETFKEMKPSKK